VTSSPGGAGPRLAFWNRYAFSVGDADFLWLDVVIAAMARAEWSAFERRLAEGLACEARAEAEHYQPSEDAIDEVASAFRHDRDLISGDEMTEWLERAGISTGAWMAFVTREVLRQTWATEMEDVLDRFAPSPRRLEAAAVVEGICSGSFDAFERSFAGHAALALEAVPSAVGPMAVDVAAIEAESARLIRQHAHWLNVEHDDDIPSRVVSVLGLEKRFQIVCDGIAGRDALHAAVEAHHLEWVTLTVDSVRFDSDSAAREAVLCVREDGLSLHDVGALARRPVRRTEVFVADADPARRDLWLSAEIGQIHGPLAIDSSFEVNAVTGRATPTLEDPRVAEKARCTAIEDAMRRAVRQHVRHRPRD
jgi:hypothetical protein